MLVEIIQPDFQFDDDRGSLVQLIRDGYKQVNVITSTKNVERGNHYHKENIEAFYIISGKFELKLKKDNIEETYVFSEGDMFRIQPYVIHSFYYLEDTTLVSMYSKGVEKDDGTKDIYTEK